jgi:hypothetical protein
MENSYRFVPCSIPQGEFYFEIANASAMKVHMIPPPGAKWNVNMLVCVFLISLLN